MCFKNNLINISIPQEKSFIKIFKISIIFLFFIFKLTTKTIFRKAILRKKFKYAYLIKQQQHSNKKHLRQK